MKIKQGGSNSAKKLGPDESSSGDRSQTKNFLVVGLGASAGGLKALSAFFDHIPDNPPVAFVVVVHLAPEHESHLESLLQRHTSLPVTQVRETLPLEPGRVYLIPPGKDLSLADGHLRLSERQARQRGVRAPIDLFFGTLAETHADRAVAIVLSGTGSDGALGLKKVKELGGVTMAQQLDEAEYDAMPRSAIATGFVDAVLPVEDLAKKVLDLQLRTTHTTAPKAETLSEEEGVALNKTLALLHSITGHDFSNYKRSTIMRRLDRRLHLQGLDTFATYLRFLQDNRADARALLRDLLITVTGFFRDPEAFSQLENKVIPKLFEDRQADETFRVWVPGCATGEEAYSIAMLLLEHADRFGKPANIQVFASDVSDEALAQAREGLYLSTIEADISDERLGRFFVRESGGYRIRKAVRDIVLFANHNLLKDPPFSKVHLISCRNLLIYLSRSIHGRLYDLFHYALLPGGFLFLGTSESADGSDLFSLVDKESRIFERRAVPHRIPTMPQVPIAAAGAAPPPEKKHDGDAPAFEKIYSRLMAPYAPASLIVNEQLEIVHLFEGSERFLRLASGRPSQNLLKLVPKELRLELRSAIYQSSKETKAIVTKTLPLRIEGQERFVEVVVQPIREEGLPGHAHVLFREITRAENEISGSLAHGGPRSTAPTEAVGHTPESQDRMIRQLEEENDRLKEELRTSIEEHEGGVEELKSANEELQSANEELKSTAEELETSREELQSINEELITINEEHKGKIEELSTANSDLQNLMAATDVGTLFLDRDFRVKRFTPPVVEVLNIIGSDIGRPLAHFTNKLDYTDLLKDAQYVLRHLTPMEREARGENDRWYSVRLRPYRTLEDRIDGVVITFVDLSARKQSEEAVRRSEENYRLLVESLPEYAIFMMDRDGHILSWNNGAERILGYKEREILGKSVAETFTQEDREASVPEKELQTAAESGHCDEDRWHLRKDGRKFWGTGVMAALYDKAGLLRGYAKIMRDNTERRKAEEALRKSEAELGQAKEMLEHRVEERTKQVRALATALMLAEQQERTRISRVLHDDLQQVLYGLEVKTRMLEQQLTAEGGNELQESLQALYEMVHKAIETTRNLTVEINPPVLKHEGLFEALRWLRTHMKKTFNLEVAIAGECPTMDEDTRSLTFQLVRELLFNIVKHASVSLARVELAEQNGHCVIRVIDEGKGFDPNTLTAPEQTHHRLGLASAAERVKLFGGSLKIDSAPGNGSCVTIVVPIGSN